MPQMTTDEATKLFDSMLSNHTKTVRDELRAEFEKKEKEASTIERMLAAPATVTYNEDGSVKVDVKKGEHRGMAMSQFLRATALARKEGKNIGDIAKQYKMDFVEKGLQAQEPGAAGIFVPEPVVSEVIDLLRSAVVVESMGTRLVPMPAGTLTMPYQDASATARYQGEVSTIQRSKQQVKQMKLAAKKLTALVYISNDLLRMSSGYADRFVRDDLVATLAVRKDQGLIRDNGTEGTMKGLRYSAPAANVNDRTLNGSSAVDLYTVTTDLASLPARVEGADVRMVSPGYLMSVRTKWFLMRLRDGLGNFVFKAEMDQGRLFGFPYKVTTSIPNNLGGTGNRSEIYFCDFDSMIVGDTLRMQLDASDQTGFETDESCVRAIAEHDCGFRYRGKEIAILTGVDWF